MPLYSNSSGTFKVGFTYNTTKDKVQRTFYKTFTYDTISMPLEIITAPSELVFESQRKTSINISVSNPYAYQTYKGYDISILSSLNGERVGKKVPYERSMVLAQIPYVLPNVQSKKEETITVEVSAKTTEGEIIKVKKVFEVTILPLQDLTVEKVLSKSDDVTATKVALYVTNNHQEIITASFEEKIPEGIFARGTTKATKEFFSGERVLVYAYDLLSTTNDATEPEIITKYSYTYLGNFIAEEKKIVVQTTPYVPQAINNTSKENSSVIIPVEQPVQEPVTRQKVTIVHILIAASVLFLVVIIITIREWVLHVHAFRIKHQSIIKQYQEIIDNSQQLRKRKKELEEEQNLLRKKMDVVEAHYKGYDDHLPDELKKLEEKKEEIKKMDAVLKERHNNLSVKIHALQEKENKIIIYEQNFASFLSRINQREERLKQDDDLLHMDFKSLKDNQESVTKQIDENYRLQNLMKDRIKNFKAKHVSNLHSKINLLASRKQRILSYHKQLELEEEHIKEEFSKLEKDLELSKEDLERAEKLYKEASVQLGKDTHEELADKKNLL
jgi:hypothetical protein